MEDGASEAEWDMVAVLDGDAPTVTTAGMDQAAALAAARTEAEAEATGTASCTEAAAKPMRAISIVSCMLMLAAASLLVKMIFAVVHTVDDTEIKPPPPLLAPPVHEHERFRCDLFALFFVFIGILEAHPLPRLCHPISGYRRGAARAASAQLASASLTP